MNATEARRILAGHLHFGDDTQIRARQSLEKILIAKELIKQCSLAEHFSYFFKPRIEVLDCEECNAEGLHIDELLAAIAELFDEWWAEATRHV